MAIARKPISGRKTNGGFEMTSNALRLVEMGVGLADALGTADADGEGDSLGNGEGDGEAAAVVWSVKVAQGFGGTLAHTWCAAGWSPAKGLIRVVKLPLLSAVAEPATLFAWSQYSVIASLGRNWPPLTVIAVFESPAVTSSVMKALTGVGVGIGVGEGGCEDVTGLGDAVGV